MITSKEALEELKRINRKQNNGKGDIWFEAIIIEPIQKDLELLEILGKYIYEGKYGFLFKNDMLMDTVDYKDDIEDYKKIKEWLEIGD